MFTQKTQSSSYTLVISDYICPSRDCYRSTAEWHPDMPRIRTPQPTITRRMSTNGFAITYCVSVQQQSQSRWNPMKVISQSDLFSLALSGNFKPCAGWTEENNTLHCVCAFWQLHLTEFFCRSWSGRGREKIFFELSLFDFYSGRFISGWMDFKGKGKQEGGREVGRESERSFG